MIDLVIIGGGYSGTLSAIEALDRAWEQQEDIKIALLEKTLGRESGGVAFSRVTAEAYHETNTALKNMGLAPERVKFEAQMRGLDPDKVVPRTVIQDILDTLLSNRIFRSFRPSRESISLERIVDEAVDVADGRDFATVTMASGKTIEARRVIIATGNLQQRHLPCVPDEKLQDKHFARRYVSDQWQADGKKKIEEIPKNKPVLVIGTALSAYDAVRTLLRQGHKGKIVLMSRHGLEHFPYPEKHTAKEIKLDVPAFVHDIYYGDFQAARKNALNEFHRLTGLRVDLDAGTVEKNSSLRRVFHGRPYTSEQVLKQWEKHLPAIKSVVGEKKIGRFLKDYSALISVLRVGAGRGICEEIRRAKKSGQLSVIAADIGRIERGSRGPVEVEYKRRGKTEAETAKFHTVISSLGPDHDYAHRQDPLWRQVIERRYTAPHGLGIGVKIKSGRDHGRLPGAERIYAAGVCAAGFNMTANGVIGPPAFSMKGMSQDIKKTADAAIDAVAREKRRTIIPPYRY